MLLGLTVAMVGMALAFNRAHYGNKPLMLKAGDQFTISNDGRWRVERHNLPMPVEPEVNQ